MLRRVPEFERHTGWDREFLLSLGVNHHDYDTPVAGSQYHESLSISDGDGRASFEIYCETPEAGAATFTAYDLTLDNIAAAMQIERRRAQNWLNALPVPAPTAPPPPQPNYAAQIAELAREFPDACSVGLSEGTSGGRPEYILWLRCEPTATGGATEVVERVIAEPNTRAHFDELNDLHQLAWEISPHR